MAALVKPFSTKPRIVTGPPVIAKPVATEPVSSTRPDGDVVPSTTTGFVSVGSALVIVMVATLRAPIDENSIVSAAIVDSAATRASRNEPAPLSAVVVTGMIAARAGAAANDAANTARARQCPHRRMDGAIPRPPPGASDTPVPGDGEVAAAARVPHRPSAAALPRAPRAGPVCQTRRHEDGR
jgi:hypothetical protein